LGEFNKNRFLEILRIVNTKNGLVLKGNKVGRSIKQMNMSAYKKEQIISKLQ
jgi:hypothetical protein